MRHALLVFVVLVLGSGPALAKKKAAPPPNHSLEAETGYASAQSMLRAGQLKEALDALNAVIASAPEWPEPYYLRAEVYEKLAGAGTDLKTLGTIDPNRDYAALADSLGHAADDLEKYLTLQPELLGRAQLMETIGDLRARETAARGNAQQIAAQKQKEEEERKAAEEKRQAELRAAEEKRKAEEEAKRRADAEAAARAAEAKRKAEEERIRQEQLARELAAKQAWQEKRDSASHVRTFGYVCAGLGVAGAAGVGAFAYLGKHQNDAIQAGGFRTSSDIQSAASTGSLYNTLAYGSAGLAVVGLGVGLPLIFMNPDPGEYHASLGLTPNGVQLTAALP